jgi:hypothetical protein
VVIFINRNRDVDDEVDDVDKVGDNVVMMMMTMMMMTTTMMRTMTTIMMMMACIK